MYNQKKKKQKMHVKLKEVYYGWIHYTLYTYYMDSFLNFSMKFCISEEF